MNEGEKYYAVDLPVDRRYKRLSPVTVEKLVVQVLVCNNCGSLVGNTPAHDLLCI